MRKKAALLCGFAGVSGALGAIIRWVQLGRIVDESGLIQDGGAVSAMLVVLLVLSAAGLAMLTLELRRYGAPTSFRDAVTVSDLFYPLASCALALVMGAAAVMLFFGASESDSPTLMRILAFLALFTAACLPPLSFRPKKTGDDGYLCLAGAIPVLFYCFWLIVSYKEHSSDPAVWVFAVEILAICSAIFSFFLAAGYIFERPRPLTTLYFSLICAVLCIVTLADDRALAEHLVFIVTAAVSLLRGAVISRNLIDSRQK